MNGNIRNSFFISALLIIALTFVGCSSSNDNSDSGAGTTSRIAVGSMTKGSVILNGVRFDDTAATVTADDTAKTSAFLADGMTVKVKGTVSADGRSGVAEAVEVVSEVRGRITAKGTDTLTIHNQPVLIDGGTVLAGGATSIADLIAGAAGDNVEVHGGRDDTTGVIHATRVEKLAAGAVADEVRGAVSGKTATTFSIGDLPITFNASVTVPAGASFVNGDIVEVNLSGGTATRIAVEHLNHPEFEAAEGGELSFEGILVGFSQTSAFKVGTQQVQLLSSARIEGGVVGDLVDGMKVEAEGHTTTGGALNAEKITIKDNVRLEANATSAGSASMMGKTVTITSGTRLDNLASAASITAGDGLRVRGFLNRDGNTITATRVTKLSNPVDPRRFIVQGQAASKDDATHTLVILGISVNASGASGIDDSGNPTTSIDQVFSSTTAGETIIKARGTVTGSTMTADELEIE